MRLTPVLILFSSASTGLGNFLSSICDFYFMAMLRSVCIYIYTMSIAFFDGVLVMPEVEGL